MYFIGIIGPVALLPQIHEIYTTKNTAGISIMTWLLITLFNMLWMVYGAIHKDKQLFFANVLVVIFDLILVIGILVYWKGKKIA